MGKTGWRTILSSGTLVFFPPRSGKWNSETRWPFSGATYCFQKEKEELWEKTEKDSHTLQPAYISDPNPEVTHFNHSQSAGSPETLGPVYQTTCHIPDESLTYSLLWEPQTPLHCMQTPRWQALHFAKETSVKELQFWVSPKSFAEFLKSHLQDITV
jgi:hypothetical protein